MHWLLVAACTAGLLVAWHVARAATFEGRAIGVIDGDTITILDNASAQHRVRLAGIDAPEEGQAFGDRSRDNLSHMISGKEVTADCRMTDHDGLPICKVWVQPGDCPQCGKTLDVGHAQIIVGLAWWYRPYANEQPLEDRGRYKSEENEARLRKHGLWADDSPMPPWEWRANDQRPLKNQTLP